MREIYCKNGEVAFVDDCIFDECRKFKWLVSADGYVYMTHNRHKIFLHYYVLSLNPTKGSELHHKNENKKDNTRRNIQVISTGTHRRIHAKKRKAEFQVKFRQWCKDNGYIVNHLTHGLILDIYRSQT